MRLPINPKAGIRAIAAPGASLWGLLNSSSWSRHLVLLLLPSGAKLAFARGPAVKSMSRSSPGACG